jgi:molybdopterin-guanine dinucleotide biosynthesis protein
MKDLHRRLREKDSEIEVLKEMVRSAQLEKKGKDNE